MPNYSIFCIFCDSLEVSETYVEGSDNDSLYEYYCYDCGESWSDDESEFEAMI